MTRRPRRRGGSRHTLVLLAVPLLAAVPAGSAAAATITAGEAQSCAIDAGGGVVCWGSDSFGARGDGPGGVSYSHDPTRVVGLTAGATDVSLTFTGGGSSSHGCAVVSGAVRCWGVNSSGVLGIGSTVRSSDVPVDVTGLASGATQVSQNASRACAVKDALAWCWGSGPLGDNEAGKDSTVPVAVSGLTAVTRVSAGWRHICAVAGGVAYCWGYNHVGQVGSAGSSPDLPRAVVGLPGPVADIAAGQDVTCALTTAGAVYCWGSNGFGKLGVGNAALTSSTTPVPVSGLTSGVTAIATNKSHVCAVQAGRALCWGEGANGKLGNGGTDNQPAPVQVRGLTGVTAIATGKSHTCATASGRNWCWGSNSHANLGNEAAGSSSAVPVPVIGAAKAPTVARGARSLKLPRNRIAALGAVVCPLGTPCTVTVPRSLRLTIGGKRFTATVLSSVKVPAGRRGAVRLRLTAPAALALRGRSVTVRVAVTAVAGAKTTRATLTTRLRG